MGTVIKFPVAERRAEVERERELKVVLIKLENLFALGGRTAATAIPVEKFKALALRAKELGGESQLAELLMRAELGEVEVKPAVAVPEDPDPPTTAQVEAGTYSEDQAAEMGYSRGKGFKGSRYEETRSLDVKEVAKLVRKDIRAAIKAGKLPKGMKTSVRIDRYAGGCSLDVTVKALPESFPIANRERIAFEAEHGTHRHCSIPLLSPEAAALKLCLESILAQYNRDNSDTMTDYFDVKFYGNVSIEWALRKADIERVKEGR